MPIYVKVCSTRIRKKTSTSINLSFYELRTSIPASPYEYLVKAVCSTCTSAAFVGMQRPHDVQVPGPTNSNIQ